MDFVSSVSAGFVGGLGFLLAEKVSKFAYRAVKKYLAGIK